MKDIYWFRSMGTNPNVTAFPGMAVPSSHLELTLDISLPESLFIEARREGETIWSTRWHRGEPCKYLTEKPGCFSMQFDVPGDLPLPDKLLCSWEGGSYEQDCRYHKISGRVTDFDGAPYLTPVYFCRTGWADCAIVVHTDDEGYYEAVLPEGIFRSVIAINSTYATSSLENWSWHMIVDRDEKLDLMVGNAETYSLDFTVSQSMGGFIVFFRPMVLPSDPSKLEENGSVELWGRSFGLIDITTPLKPSDLSLDLNGTPLEITNMHMVYETTTDTAMPAYLIFCKAVPMSGKQTLRMVCRIDGSDGRAAAYSEGRYQFMPGNLGGYVK